MNMPKFFCMLGLAAITGNVQAYGSSSSSKKACDKPRFTEFMPADKATVAARSAFSFKASAATNPESIKVTIKNQPVAINVVPENPGFRVNGMLPETLKGNYARINISAEGANQCKGGDGWLVNIAE